MCKSPSHSDDRSTWGDSTPFVLYSIWWIWRTLIIVQNVLSDHMYLNYVITSKINEYHPRGITTKSVFLCTSSPFLAPDGIEKSIEPETCDTQHKLCHNHILVYLNNKPKLGCLIWCYLSCVLSVQSNHGKSARHSDIYAPVERVRNPSRYNAHEMPLVYAKDIRCVYITMLNFEPNIPIPRRQKEHE